MNDSVKRFSGKFASWHLWLNLLAMLVVVVLLFLGLKWWLNVYTHHGEGIEVPDLVGADYRKAVDLVEAEGLAIEVSDSTYIKEMPAGSIVVQSPAKGMLVKEGRTIYVTINSLTIPRVRIPDLIDNCSYREAQARLQQLVVFVVAHRQRGVDGSRHEEVQVRGKTYPLIVKVVLHTHAYSQLAEPHAPDAHTGTLLFQRILAAARDDDHRVVHGCLKDVDDWYAVVHNLHRLTELQRGGLTLALADARHGRIGRRGMHDLHIDTRLLVKALLQGHIVTGKLGLRRPLRSEHHAFLRPQRQDGGEKKQ